MLECPRCLQNFESTKKYARHATFHYAPTLEDPSSAALQMYDGPKSMDEYLKIQNKYLRKIVGGHRVSALGDKELSTKLKHKRKQSVIAPTLFTVLIIAETLG